MPEFKITKKDSQNIISFLDEYIYEREQWTEIQESQEEEFASLKALLRELNKGG